MFFRPGGGETGAPLASRLGAKRALVRVHDDTPEAAARCAEELRAEHPGGPYRLAGWGDAGVLAFEAARRLVSVGERVDLVVLIDSVPPPVLSGRFDGGVVLYRADERAEGDSSLGWYGWCPHLRIVRIPGTRLSESEPAQVAAVANHLEGVLAERDRAARLGG
ncbi:thioesterase domain-containing protein [Amycolatopsis anabasis]|uniref:thioesterase domain-containing protein n=1 Tax=Amycolatopsis anabasis TaxID=1840409 RepID=UPI00131BAC3D|nr:thioesterase domain-containing protein [Amycolatopsis anabasis]